MSRKSTICKERAYYPEGARWMRCFDPLLPPFRGDTYSYMETSSHVLLSYTSSCMSLCPAPFAWPFLFLIFSICIRGERRKSISLPRGAISRHILSILIRPPVSTPSRVSPILSDYDIFLVQTSIILNDFRIFHIVPTSKVKKWNIRPKCGKMFDFINTTFLFLTSLK